MSKEIWKNIKEYEGIYQVSNLGRVKRIGSYRNQTKEWTSDRILKACRKDNDYLFVTLSQNGIPSRKYIHRLVAQAFIPNPEAKETVNHIDLNRTNNDVSNLEWNTYKENNAHALAIMKKNGKNKRNQTDSKPVMQFNLIGDFIREYPSTREVQRQTGIYGVEKVCNGQRKTAGGFIWVYK